MSSTIPTSSSKASTNNVVDLDIEVQEENIQEEVGVAAEIIPLRKERKLTSKVWEEMSRITAPSGEIVAQCNWCRKKLSGSSSTGTSHLTKHLNNCTARKYKSKGQLELQTRKNVATSKSEVQAYKFDQEKSRKDLAKMIIKHNYSFAICEYEYFEIFRNGLNPNFKLVSRNTTRLYVISVYKEKKGKDLR